MRERPKGFRIANRLAGIAGLWALVILCGHSAYAGGGSFQNVAPDTEAKVWFQAGQEALQKNDLEGAEKAFRRVLEMDPSAGPAHANLGVIAMRRKHWEAARKELKRAATLMPNTTGVRLNIGLVEFRSGEYAAAIPVLESVLRDEPGATQPRYLLGLSQVFVDDYAGAVKTLEPLWESMSGDLMYVYVLDIAANKSGNGELDQRAMKQFLKVGGNTPEFHLILAKAHLQHHEPAQAIEELQKAEAGNPLLPFLHFNFGFAYLGIGQYERSEAEFLRDAEIDPDLADNYYQLGVLYTQWQRPQDAEKAFKECLKREPQRPGAWFGLARIYSDGGRNQEALLALDQALSAAPKSDRVHLLKGQVLQRLGRKEEARAEFETGKALMNEKLNKDREDLNEQLVPTPELKSRTD